MKNSTINRPAVLCYLRRKSPSGQTEYLLGLHQKYKKRNGFGGKIGDTSEIKGETPEEAILREGREEYGITVINPTKVAEIEYDYIEDGEEIHQYTYVYMADEWEGEIIVGPEITDPIWYTIKDMPWDEMWGNDKIWLNEVIKREDEFLTAYFRLNEDGDYNRFDMDMKWRPLNQAEPTR